MATFEKRDGVTIAFLNRKDFGQEETSDQVFTSYVCGFGGFGAVNLQRNPALRVALKKMNAPKYLRDLVIVVEEVSNQLDPFEVDAIIDHEIAHIKFKHTKAEANLGSLVFYPEFELQADEYSAMRNGAAVMKSGLLKVARAIADHGASVVGVGVAGATSAYKKIIAEKYFKQRLDALDKMA